MEEVKKNVLKAKEAAKYLGIHENTLYKSKIPFFRIGRNKYYRISTLEKMIEEAEKTRGAIG